MANQKDDDHDRRLLADLGRSPSPRLAVIRIDDSALNDRYLAWLPQAALGQEPTLVKGRFGATQYPSLTTAEAPKMLAGTRRQ